MSDAIPSALQVDLQDSEGRWIAGGRLVRDGETTVFSSFESYWEAPSRPVLGQVFEQRGPSWRPSARAALPSWFSNLLPEGTLRDTIARAVGVKAEREFALLARIGRDDLPGALRLHPVDIEADMSMPDDEIPAVEHADASGSIKFSLAGVQLKFSLTEHGRGLTIPATGESGTWIAKLPDARVGYEGVPEAEYAAMQLAAASGIDVPETRLVDVSGIGGLPEWARTNGWALLVRRFDRRLASSRVHAEDLAQVLDIRPARKYERANFETVARTVAALSGAERVGEVIDRIVLNILVGNGDAHVKNWTFIYPDGSRPQLSPAYDIVPTVLYVPHDDLGLKLNGSRSFADVDLAAFGRLAEKAGWDGGLGRERADRAVQRVLAAWPVLGEHLGRDALRRLTERRDTLRKLLP